MTSDHDMPYHHRRRDCILAATAAAAAAAAAAVLLGRRGFLTGPVVDLAALGRAVILRYGAGVDRFRALVCVSALTAAAAVSRISISVILHGPGNGNRRCIGKGI